MSVDDDGAGVVLDVLGAMRKADGSTRARMAAAALAARDEGDKAADAGDAMKTLVEICGEIHRTPSWGHRIGIPEACSIRFAGGRPLYKLRDVLMYLNSAECARRREELRRTKWGRRPAGTAREGVRRD